MLNTYFRNNLDITFLLGFMIKIGMNTVYFINSRCKIVFLTF